MRGATRRPLPALAAVLTATAATLVPTGIPPAGSAPAGHRPSRAMLPDIGIRTLRNFEIVHDEGRKMLKFPGVTANVGRGALEIHGKRRSSTARRWVARQTVYHRDGTTTVRPPAGATFYYAGDGHSHWHIRNFDSYKLLDEDGVVRRGEKHGFCFEDNTAYRDWPQNSTHGAPKNPVYTHDNVCGVGRPRATRIMHGLSVGWGDTYPATLPDQGIDITGVPDGTYTVRVTADWQHFWRESDDTNNSASARIEISGDSVTLLSTHGGL